MRYAILAAGEGSRLHHEGIAVPKPLVTVAGETLIDRLIRIFMKNGAEKISVICRSEQQVVHHLQQCQHAGLPIEFMVRDTPSSMHSFYELTNIMDAGLPFVVTTIDTIFKEEEFAAYLEAFLHMLKKREDDGLMGVTDYIDDEKPLYVKTDDNQGILAFLDNDEQQKYVSGGIYGLTPTSLTTLNACILRGESRMRNFQRALLADRMRLKAWLFTKVLDIDHAGDIAKAEKFLST